MIQRISKTKSWFFGKINMIDKPISELTKRGNNIKINKIRKKKGDITRDTNKIYRIIGHTL